ncbi:thioredoxin family protein [bacterium]|nr:thioredoxin family protein [bacterium]
MIYRILYLLALFLTLQSCTTHVSRKQVINDEPVLIGIITQTELFAEFPIFKANYESYTPNDSVIHALRQFSGNIHVKIFLGTWCGDSKRNLSFFLKTLDLEGLANLTYTLYGLDRTKRDKQQLTVKYAISRVPTMVFLKNNAEIGRITEHPSKSVEEDMLSILQQ